MFRTVADGKLWAAEPEIFDFKKYNRNADSFLHLLQPPNSISQVPETFGAWTFLNTDGPRMLVADIQGQETRGAYILTVRRPSRFLRFM